MGGSFHRRLQMSGPGDRPWEVGKRLVAPKPPREGKGLDPALKAMLRKQSPLCLEGSSGSNGEAEVLLRASFRKLDLCERKRVPGNIWALRSRHRVGKNPSSPHW